MRVAFLASELGQGASPADLQRVEQIYDVSYNGVLKATATDPAYCTDQRTKEIKADLTRHLAGDFTPPPRQKIAADSGGLFSGFDSSGSSGPDTGAKIQKAMADR